MPYTPILATLVYVMSKDGTNVMMIRRDKRPDDLHYGKYNGLGGKLDRGEDVFGGMRREVLEEAGINVIHAKLRGTISWPGFGKNGEDWFGFIFKVDAWEGEVKTENHEGTLEWVDVNKLNELNLWNSDRDWLHMVFDADERIFYGVAPFENGKAISWQFERI